MKLRTPPDPPKSFPPDPYWERGNECRDLVRLRLKNPAAVLPKHLTLDQLVAVEAAAAEIQGGFANRVSRRHFLRALKTTWPRVAAPDCNTPIRDLADAWTQPEARAFW